MGATSRVSLTAMDRLIRPHLVSLDKAVAMRDMAEANGINFTNDCQEDYYVEERN